MELLYSCKSAIESCLSSRTFAIAHLHKEEKTMDMHIHDCYELYYSISGGKQFLIDNRVYPIAPGDLFVINQYESHKLTQIDSGIHERIVLSIHPEYLHRLSSPQTDLGLCFTQRNNGFSHRISLNREQQNQFLYFISKITDCGPYAQDILEQAAFMQLMAMVNQITVQKNPAAAADSPKYNDQVQDILLYINRSLSQPLTIDQLAQQFYLSESYLCRIFKSATGTTINKYITARRISIAKAFLNEGLSVAETFERSGFSDYSSFYKSFTRTVGVSPKKYASLSHS